MMNARRWFGCLLLGCLALLSEARAQDSMMAAKAGSATGAWRKIPQWQVDGAGAIVATGDLTLDAGFAFSTGAASGRFLYSTDGDGVAAWTEDLLYFADAGLVFTGTALGSALLTGDETGGGGRYYGGVRVFQGGLELVVTDNAAGNYAVVATVFAADNTGKVGVGGLAPDGTFKFRAGSILSDADVAADNETWWPWSSLGAVGFNGWGGLSPGLDGLRSNSNGELLFVPVRFGAGSVVTQLDVKWSSDGVDGGVKFRLLKRDESATSSNAFTVVGAQQTATGSGDFVTLYNIPNETLTAGGSLTLEIESVSPAAENVDLWGGRVAAIGRRL